MQRGHLLKLFALITMPPLQEISHNVQRQRRGLPLTPLEKRSLKLRPPIQRIERSYNIRKKIKVLTFLLYYRVIDPRPLSASQRRQGMAAFPGHDKTPGYRPPTFAEALNYFVVFENPGLRDVL